LARQYGFPHKVFQGGKAIHRRFPQLINLTENQWAIYEPGGGTILVENCLKALQVDILMANRVLRTEYCGPSFADRYN
jgi:hypothetical protein